MKRIGKIVGIGFLLVCLLKSQDREGYLQSEVIGKNILIRPNDVAVDMNSNIYVVDSTAKAIVKFNKEGKFLTRWQTEDIPLVISIDLDNSVWVGMKGKIAEFDTKGNLIFVTEWRGKNDMDEMFDIVVVNGYLYVSEPRARVVEKYKIYEIKTNGKESEKRIEKVSEITVRPCCGLTGIGQWKSNLAIAHLTSFSVDVYNSDDRKIFSFGHKDVFGGGCCNPVDVACDEEGNFYTTLRYPPGGLLKFSPNGKLLTTMDFTGPGVCARYPVAVDRKGSIVVVCDKVNSCVHVWKKLGEEKEI